MALAGVQLKLRAWYRPGVQPGVLGRDRGIRVTVMDRGRNRDGTQFETPGPGEDPQVLSHSPAPAAERLDIVGQERVADAGLAMRFPRFTGRWRDDKGPQDATTTGELVDLYRAARRASAAT